jgi:hypothetical protein
LSSIVHLVVEQHTGAGHHQPRAERHVDGERGRDRHALLVDDGEVRGVRALGGGRLKRQRHRALGGNPLGLRDRVLGRGELRDVDLDGVGIAEPHGAIVEDQARGLDP